MITVEQRIDLTFRIDEIRAWGVANDHDVSAAGYEVLDVELWIGTMSRVFGTPTVKEFLATDDSLEAMMSGG